MFSKTNTKRNKKCFKFYAPLNQLSLFENKSSSIILAKKTKKKLELCL